MANWAVLKAAIADVIKTNGNQEITGAVLQNTLNSIVNAIGENATFAGVATPTTNPGAPDGNVFYITSISGLYPNFGGLTIVEEGINIIFNYNNAWHYSALVPIVQNSGQSASQIMSQKAVTDFVNEEYNTLRQYVRGEGDAADGQRGPYKWMGSVKDDGGLNALLDGLHGSGEAGKPKAGFFRGDYDGSPFTVENVPVNYAEDMWLQSVRGRLSPVYAGDADTYKGLTRSSDVYSVLWRVRENGTWEAWNSLTDAPRVPETDLSMGVKDGDLRSCLGIMRTRKGGCYSVTNDAGQVTGIMMVFCDSWGQHGIEQVLLTDVSDLEGGIVHSLSGHTHVDGKPMLYHRFYDMNREADGRWGAWKTFSMGGGTTEHPYAAFDFGTLQEKIGSGRTQDDLDAFGLTEIVWDSIRTGETMVVRDDAHERTYIVSGSSDDYISFSFGLYASDDYEGYTIRDEGDTYTISRHQTQGGGGGESITIE